MARKVATQAAGPVVQRLPLTKARVNLGAVVKRVHLAKEYVILEKDGIPVAGLMNIEEFEDYLELQEPRVQETIRKSTEDFLAGRSRRARDLLTDLTKKPGAKKKRRRTA